MKKQGVSVLILSVHQTNNYQLFFRKWDPGVVKDPFKDDFLKCKPMKNDYHFTSSHLNLMKTYMDQQVEEDDKLSQIEKLNRSMEYMQNNDHFSIEAFESDVFENTEHIKSFADFRKNYARDHELEIADEFEISPDAIRKNQRFIRSVIKLDKNFHVYVHGNRRNIIRGFDPEKNMYFYTLYFDEES